MFSESSQKDIQYEILKYIPNTVIPNLGYAYTQGYEPGHLGECEKLE
jgi:hypothetical protein